MEPEEIVEEIVEDAVVEEVDGDEEVPLFLTESDEEVTDVVPAGAIGNVRRKLKGKINERDEEIERLKAEIAASKQPVTVEPVKRPRVADFASDEEYEAAMDVWEQSSSESTVNTLEQRRREQRQLEQTQQQLKESVDGHYNRAEELIKKHSIAPDVYVTAEQSVRQSIEAFNPGKGNAIFEHFAAALGEGSEKTMLYLGRNKAALNEFKVLLSGSPTAMQVGVYLGNIKSKVNNTTKRKSQAPAPAAQANGDVVVSPSEAKMRKEYDKLHSSGKAGAAFTLMRKAKAAGVDTKQWNK